MILLMIVICLLLFQLVRDSRNDVLLCTSRHRFFALRDRLRRIAIEDPSLGRNWLFPYLDSTISKTIDILPFMSAWQVIALAPAAKADSDYLDKVLKQLNQELQKPKNALLMEIYNEMWTEIANHLKARHFVMTAEIRTLDACIEKTRSVKASLWTTLRKRERASFEYVLLAEPERPTSSAPMGNHRLRWAH